MLQKIKEIWKANKIGYFISAIFLSLGYLIIYTKQHNRFSFNIGEYFMCLPFILFLLLIFMFAFAMFLGDKE